jgi:NAD(P)-dependent dehydrogenase (short-subunit alcohol dehydrogenase family)
MSQWTVADAPDLTGRVVVVTGANSGLGYEGTKAFARKGARVVMACRSVDRGEAAAAEIREDVPDAALDVRECDLADLSNVEAFAEGLLAEYDDLHLLCNNAGVMAIPREETVDGFEKQFGVNHFGHFALTGHLLDRLVATDGDTRVVTQSSSAHTGGSIDFEDLYHEQSYGKWTAYSQSKLANLLFAYELQRRLDAAGVDSTESVGCHPGYAATNLQYKGPEKMGSAVRKVGMRVANAVLGQSAAMGALPMVKAAVAGDVAGGDYVGPGGLFNARGYPETQQSNEKSRDEELAERLWTVSEDETGVEYAFEHLAATA